MCSKSAYYCADFSVPFLLISDALCSYTVIPAIIYTLRIKVLQHELIFLNVLSCLTNVPHYLACFYFCPRHVQLKLYDLMNECFHCWRRVEANNKKNAGYKATMHKNEKNNGHLLHIWTFVSIIQRGTLIEYMFFAVIASVGWMNAVLRNTHMMAGKLLF